MKAWNTILMKMQLCKNTYYYDESGALQKNVSVTLDGVAYTVNEKGVASVTEQTAEAEAEAVTPEETADGAAPADVL